jgi:alpha/beta superfamily hydrolase
MMIQGAKDELVPEANVAKLVHKLSNQRDISIDYRVIPGATHYFTDKTEELAIAVDSFLAVAPSLNPGMAVPVKVGRG